MIRQRAHASSGGQVPEANGGVVTAGDHLRIRTLANHRSHGVRVAGETENLCLGAHVPDLK